LVVGGGGGVGVGVGVGVVGTYIYCTGIVVSLTLVNTKVWSMTLFFANHIDSSHFIVIMG
jgi:hypothetical protein